MAAFEGLSSDADRQEWGGKQKWLRRQGSRSQILAMQPDLVFPRLWGHGLGNSAESESTSILLT